jgi:hypothetical protein
MGGRGGGWEGDGARAQAGARDSLRKSKGSRTSSLRANRQPPPSSPSTVPKRMYRCRTGQAARKHAQSAITADVHGSH